jgi:hypothetical protein
MLILLKFCKKSEFVMLLSASPLSSQNLRQNPRRFFSLLGVTVEQFDQIFEDLFQLHLQHQIERNSLQLAERVVRRNERHRDRLKEHFCITLLYLRQYSNQELIAAAFGLSQGQISKIINHISLLLEHVLPVPEKLAEQVYNFLRTLDPQLRKQYAATLIIDASEQRIQRSADAKQQRKDFSGKKRVIIENVRSPRLKAI